MNVFFDDNVVEIGSVVGNPLTLSIKTKLFQASFSSVCTSYRRLSFRCYPNTFYGLVFVSVKNYRALILLVKILPRW